MGSKQQAIPPRTIQLEGILSTRGLWGDRREALSGGSDDLARTKKRIVVYTKGGPATNVSRFESKVYIKECLFVSQTISILPRGPYSQISYWVKFAKHTGPWNQQPQPVGLIFAACFYSISQMLIVAVCVVPQWLRRYGIPIRQSGT